MPRRVLLRRPPAAPEDDPEGDHPDAEHEVQPVVRGVERDDVGRRRLVDGEAIDPEGEVDDAADEQVAPQPSRTPAPPATTTRCCEFCTARTYPGRTG